MLVIFWEYAYATMPNMLQAKCMLPTSHMSLNVSHHRDTVLNQSNANGIVIVSLPGLQPSRDITDEDHTRESSQNGDNPLRRQ